MCAAWVQHTWRLKYPWGKPEDELAKPTAAIDKDNQPDNTISVSTATFTREDRPRKGEAGMMD
jgi:hypothetical protein